MSDPTPDPLDALLRESAPIVDAGFTERVLHQLPRRRFSFLRIAELVLPPLALAAVAPLLPLPAACALSFGIVVYATAR